LSPKKSLPLLAVVDTVASFSVFPAVQLRRLGLVPTGRETFELANGRTVRLPIGEAILRVNGKARECPVVFGAGATSLLGATVLEILGYAVNPTKHRLEKQRALAL
jgi:predicted aspartyl protease